MRSVHNDVFFCSFLRVISNPSAVKGIPVNWSGSLFNRLTGIGNSLTIHIQSLNVIVVLYGIKQLIQAIVVKAIAIEPQCPVLRFWKGFGKIIDVIVGETIVCSDC